MTAHLLWSVYRINTIHPFTISRGSRSYYDVILVKISRGQIHGYGEAAPSVRYGETTETVLEKIRKINIESILDYGLFSSERIAIEIRKQTRGSASLQSALEMAVYDLWGKELGIPLYQLFGGYRDDTPVTSFTIGIDESDILRKKVRDAEGYPLLKVKLGSRNDKEIIDTIREETDKRIRVDANEGWNRDTALQMIHWLSERNIEFVEQPLPAEALDDMRWLKSRSPLELVADENSVHLTDIPALAEAFHGINIKLMKCGGLLEAYKMIHAAQANSLKIMLGCMIETSVAITAAAHLSPLVHWADLDGNILINNDPFTGVKVKNGKLILPDSPGLGVNQKEDIQWTKK